MAKHIASPAGSFEPHEPPPELELLALAEVDALVEEELEEEELLELADDEEDEEVADVVEVVDPIDVVEPVLEVLPVVVIVDDDVMPPVPVAVIPPVPVLVADPVCCGILSWSTEAISSQPVTSVTAPKATVQGT